MGTITANFIRSRALWLICSLPQQREGSAWLTAPRPAAGGGAPFSACLGRVLPFPRRPRASRRSCRWGRPRSGSPGRASARPPPGVHASAAAPRCLLSRLRAGWWPPCPAVPSHLRSGGFRLLGRGGPGGAEVSSAPFTLRAE